MAIGLEEEVKNSFRFGSSDSVDEDRVYVFDQMLKTVKESNDFCSRGSDNRNIAVVKNGVISECFKGTPDALNNAIFETTSLHTQEGEVPVTQRVKRNVPLALVANTRTILTGIRRTDYRSLVMPALKSYDQAQRMKALAKVDFRKLGELDPDQRKNIAFQFGNLNALINGVEVYTKKETAAFDPSLAQFIYRDGKQDLGVLNEQRDRLLDQTRWVYTRKDEQTPMNVFCFKNAPAIGESIEDWNQYYLQSRGMIIDLKQERAVQYPLDKFFRLGELKGLSRENLPNPKGIEVCEKVDGSMVSVFKYNGEVVFSSKGNFGTRFSKEAERIADKKHGGLEDLDFDDNYYVFELVSPINRFPEGMSIVDYGDREELVLVGMRDRLTNEDKSYSEIENHANNKGLSSPKKYQSCIDTTLRRADSHSGFKKEGYVGRFRDGSRVKIKYTDFHDATKQKGLLITNNFVPTWVKSDERTREEMMESMPEAYRDAATKQLGEYKQIFDGIEGEVRGILDDHGKIDNFPAYVKGNVRPELQKIVLRSWKGNVENNHYLIDRLVVSTYKGGKK